MLPMEEVYGSNLFVIDPNTRTINVPVATFARNGVSVTGDEYAETLIFEIDRFFDTTDLTTTDIYVQWTNPAGEEGASKITMLDYNSKPGKLLFGWPLNSRVTVENATQTNGQLKFAVRFFKRDGTGAITYSLNTLPATVTIKQALYTGFTLSEDQIDDPTLALKEAISNGPASDGPEAQVPVYYADLHEIRYLDEGVNDTDKESLKLSVCASTTDSGVRDYFWYFKPRYIVDNEPKDFDIIEKHQLEVPVKTNDSEVITGKKYYKEADGGFVPYDPEAQDFDLAKAYEPNSTFDVVWAEGEHVTGSYWVETRNRVGKRTARKRSSASIVECPESIVFNEGSELPKNKFLSKDENDNLSTTLNVATTALPAACDIAYKWEYKNTIDGALAEYKIKNEEGDETEVVASTGPRLTVTEPGWYRVTATASLNKEDMYVMSDAECCRVVAPIKAPVVEPPVQTDAIAHNLAIGEQTVLEAKVVEPLVKYLESDEIEFQWYRNQPDENGEKIEPDAEGKYPSDIIKIENTPTGSKLTVQYLGGNSAYYYCEVINKLADDSASTLTNVYVVY